jgi:hypothetical protein
LTDKKNWTDTKKSDGRPEKIGRMQKTDPFLRVRVNAALTSS